MIIRKDVEELGLTRNFGDNKKSQYEIRTTPLSMRVKDLIASINSQEYVLPSIQRKSNAWNKNNKKIFIDSIMKNFPIPSIMILKGKRESIILDGQQRLNALLEFSNNKFTWDCNHKQLKYFDLTEDQKYHFDTFPMLVLQIEQSSPKQNEESLAFEIFSRINTGSVKLTDMEVRFASYHSPFSKYLKTLSEDITKDPNNIFYSKNYETVAENILRAFAFYLFIDFEKTKNEFIFKFNGKVYQTFKLKETKDLVMERLAKEQVGEQSSSLIQEFVDTLNKFANECGLNNFKIIDENAKIGKTFQINKIDILSLWLTYHENTNDDYIHNLERLQDRNIKLINNLGYAEYKKYYKNSSTSLKNINTRFKFMAMDIK